MGWNYALDTAKLAAGSHTFTATAVTTDGREYAASRAFSLQVPTTYTAIDLPASGGTYQGRQQLHGWSMDNADAISSVNIAIDGVNFGNAIYGSNRVDACTTVGNYPGCPNVGWALSYDTRKIPNGWRSLTVTASTTDKIPRTFSLHTSFFVANGSSSPPDPKLAPGTPTKEYILLNGKPIAVENAH